MRKITNTVIIWFNRIVMIFLAIFIGFYLAGLTIIPIGSYYILYSISCAIVVYVNCYAIDVLQRINKKIKDE